MPVRAFWRTSAARDREKQDGILLARIERLERAPTLEALRHALTTASEDNERLREQVARITDTTGELKQQASDFTIALADGIEHVDRAERRVKSTVARARAKFASGGYADADLDAEASDIHARDGDRGAEEGVYPVPALVEPASEPSSVRGVSRSQLAKVRKIG